MLFIRKHSLRFPRLGLVSGMFALMLGSGGAVSAQIIGRGSLPAVSLVISNLSSGISRAVDLPSVREATDDQGQPVWKFDEFTLRDPDFEVTFQATLDPDPSISYSLAVIDLGSPTAFSFLFSTPIVPTGSPNTVAASVLGTLSDAGGDGVSLTPTSGLLQIGSLLSPTTGMGVDVGPAASHPASTAPGPWIYPYGLFLAGPLAGPGPGPWTGLSVGVDFALSGGEDRFSVSGEASILEGLRVVPEAGTWVAGGALGAGALLAHRRSRRRA